jgi:hypothetical protein
MLRIAPDFKTASSREPTDPPLLEYRQSTAQIIAEHPDMFIGALVWFSIAGTVTYVNNKRTTIPVSVSYQTLKQHFDALNLDASFLPPPIRKVDAFRAASTAAKDNYPLPTEGQHAELLVREVTFDPDQVIRHVMREVRDTRGQKLSYDHVATLKFFRGGRTADGRRNSGDHYRTQILHGLAPLDREHVQNLVATFEANYITLSESLQSQALRAVIRSYVSYLNAIIVKPTGGVYFVHHSRQPTLDALQELARRIGQGCSFEQFPLVNTHDSRQMLTEAFQSEVENACRELLAEIAALNEKARANGDRINVKKYAEMNDRYQEVLSRSEEYTRVLGLSQGRAGAALELAMDSVMDLATRLDIGGKK